MKKSACLIALLTMLALVFQVNAATWNPFKHEGRVKAHTVIITGNFVESRLLAELAQYYTKQPLLIVSPGADGETKLFYLPNAKEARDVTADELMDVITFITPKRIIILGSKDYVPASFTERIQDSYPVITIDGADWSKNAETLGQIIGEKRLRTQYDESLFKIRVNSAK